MFRKNTNLATFFAAIAVKIALTTVIQTPEPEIQWGRPTLTQSFQRENQSATAVKLHSLGMRRKGSAYEWQSLVSNRARFHDNHFIAFGRNRMFGTICFLTVFTACRSTKKFQKARLSSPDLPGVCGNQTSTTFCTLMSVLRSLISS